MRSRMLILIGMLLVGCGLVSADTITVTGVDKTRGLWESLWINEHGTPTNVTFAGVINIVLNNTYSRDSLCAQLFVDIGFGTYNTVILTPERAQRTFGRNLQEAAWLVSTEMPTATTPDMGAALQLAIWDIVEDGGDGLAAGSVAASSDPDNPTDPIVLALANAYEKEVLGPDLLGPFQTSEHAFIYVNTHTDTGAPAQMLIGPEFGDGPQPIPEPSTFALEGGGLIVACLTLRKKIRHGSRNATPAS